MSYSLETYARLIWCIFGENSVFLSVLIINIGPYFSLNIYEVESKSKKMCAIHTFIGITCVKNCQNYEIEKNVQNLRFKNSIILLFWHHGRLKRKNPRKSAITCENMLKYVMDVLETLFCENSIMYSKEKK